MTDEYRYGVQRAIEQRIAEEIEHGFDDLHGCSCRPVMYPSGLYGCWLASWNNHPGRTHSDVLAMLDAAIERQRARLR